MADDDEYTRQRDRARAAIARMKRAADEERGARLERNAAVRAMLAKPASLGAVARDLDISKSSVRLIQLEERAGFGSVDQARRYLKEHDQREE